MKRLRDVAAGTVLSAYLAMAVATPADTEARDIADPCYPRALTCPNGVFLLREKRAANNLNLISAYLRESEGGTIPRMHRSQQPSAGTLKVRRPHDEIHDPLCDKRVGARSFNYIFSAQCATPPFVASEARSGKLVANSMAK